MYLSLCLRYSVRYLISTACLLLALSVSTSAIAANAVFFNEIHYDNAGGDVNEGVEIAGPSGLDLSGWQLLFYNGNGGNLYGSVELSGTIPELSNGFGLLSFETPGVQNGPDGFALVNNLDEVIQFLSYEGTFTATEGAANGLVSQQIGVEEETSSAVTDSLQLVGSGRYYDDFQWQGPQIQSFSAINSGQTIAPSAVPLPAALPLFLSGIAGFSMLARGRRV
jgi:uncharacterized protein